MAIIGKDVHKYDFNEVVRGNGYRTHLKLYGKVLIEIQQSFTLLNTQLASFFNESNSGVNQIRTWKKFLISFYPIVCTVSKIIELGHENLILKRNNHFNIFMNRYYVFLSQKVFYGKLFGFQYNKKISRVINLIVSSLVSFNQGYEASKNRWVQAMILLSKNSYYILNPTKRAKKLKKIFLNPTIEFIQSFLSLTEDFGLHSITSIVAPTVQVSKKISLLINDFNLTKINGEEVKVLSISKTLTSRLDSTLPCRLISFIAHTGQTQLIKNLSTHKNLAENSDMLLFYIHGGGFVGLSSKTCEIFLKEWTTDLECPIFSVDYTLSPQATFPVALHECFYAYSWAILNSDKIGWNGKKIVLAGDSAGGNLVFGVIHMAISEGIRIPDGAMCIYPNCETSMNISPSRILIHIDPLLSFGFLTIARDSYFGFKSVVSSSEIENLEDENCDLGNTNQSNFSRESVLKMM